MRHGLLALCFLLCLGCTRTPDEQAIREAITAGSAAAKAKHAGKLLEIVSEDFIGNDSLDRKQLGDFLRLQLLGANALDATIGPITVEVQGDRATATFAAQVTDSSGRWIADRAATLQFETGWRREGGSSRCYNAHWTQP
jgi:hypothetical protein